MPTEWIVYCLTAPSNSELSNVRDHTDMDLLGKYFTLNFKLFAFLAYKSLEPVSINDTHTHTKPCMNGLRYGNYGK